MDTNNQFFQRSTPESEGIHSGELLEFIRQLETIPSPNSMLLLRHGKVVAEGWWYPYRPEAPHMLFSLTKSFTSTAVGFAEAEGLLSLDETILSIFPDDAPARPSKNLRAMQIRHLLSMVTGHDQDSTKRTLSRRDQNTAKGFLSVPVKHTPGTHFVYNSGASQILSLIVQTRSGQSLKDYLTPRLFEPLGIDEVEWENLPDGTNCGGWGLSLKTEDIAKFGQLYLQDGTWEGRRILPEGWVERATAKQVDNGTDPMNDWNQGYGYQFWRNRGNMYRGDGAFGQFCYVIAEKDAVLAMTCGVGDMQAVMNAVHDILLPAMMDGALPENRQAQVELDEKLASLCLPPFQGQMVSTQVKELSGKRYRFEKNHAGMKWIEFEFGESQWKTRFEDKRGKHEFEGDYTNWNKVDDKLYKAVSSAGWDSDDHFTFQVCLFTTPFIINYEFRFELDRVSCRLKQNVSMMEQDQTTIIGIETHFRN